MQKSKQFCNTAHNGNSSSVIKRIASSSVYEYILSLGIPWSYWLALILYLSQILQGFHAITLCGRSISINLYRPLEEWPYCSACLSISDRVGPYTTVNYLPSGWVELLSACGKLHYWPSLVILLLPRTFFSKNIFKVSSTTRGRIILLQLVARCLNVRFGLVCFIMHCSRWRAPDLCIH